MTSESLKDDSSVFHLRLKRFRHVSLLLIAIGPLVQLSLSAYYLSITRAPVPHDLPVAVVVSENQQPAIRQQVEQGPRNRSNQRDEQVALKLGTV